MKKTFNRIFNYFGSESTNTFWLVRQPTLAFLFPEKNQLIELKEENHGDLATSRFTVVISRVSKFNRSCNPLQRRIYTNEKDRVDFFQVLLWPRAAEREKKKVAKPSIKIIFTSKTHVFKTVEQSKSNFFANAQNSLVLTYQNTFRESSPSLIFVTITSTSQYSVKYFSPSGISCPET